MNLLKLICVTVFLVTIEFEHVSNFAIDQSVCVIIKLSIYQVSIPRLGSIFHIQSLADNSILNHMNMLEDQVISILFHLSLSTVYYYK